MRRIVLAITAGLVLFAAGFMLSGMGDESEPPRPGTTTTWEIIPWNSVEK